MTAQVVVSVAGALAIAPGLIHFGAAPEHFAEAFEFGVFMVAVGAAQIAAGLLLIARPSHALIVATIVGTTLIFVIYALSRTTGLPFGPHVGEREEIHFVDVVSKSTELALLLALIYLLKRWRPKSLPVSSNTQAGASSVSGGSSVP